MNVCVSVELKGFLKMRGSYKPLILTRFFHQLSRDTTKGIPSERVCKVEKDSGRWKAWQKSAVVRFCANAENVHFWLPFAYSALMYILQNPLCGFSLSTGMAECTARVYFHPTTEKMKHLLIQEGNSFLPLGYPRITIFAIDIRASYQQTWEEKGIFFSF